MNLVGGATRIGGRQAAPRAAWPAAGLFAVGIAIYVAAEQARLAGIRVALIPTSTCWRCGSATGTGSCSGR